MTDISFAAAKSCPEVWKLLDYEETNRFCCGSCHADAELGYDFLAELDLPGGAVGNVCCAVVRAWEEEAPLPSPERSES